MRAPNSRHRQSFVVHRTICFFLMLVMLPGAALVPPTPEPPWSWPVDGVRTVTAPFLVPAHDYGAGHRGVDMAAPVGTAVHAPADGIVAFRGVVVDRPLITIDHGGGMVTTWEPVQSALVPGVTVTAGEEIGTVALGGHTDADELHLGVRLDDVYINPMLMFGEVPRAILLPCCAASTSAAADISRTGTPTAFTRGGGRVGRSR